MPSQSNPDADLETNFELNDTLYARASISPADAEEVYLWLGANVMLAYPLNEAESMLDDKLSGAEQSLKNCEEDLEFLREQITVSLDCWFLAFEFLLIDIYFCRHWRSLRHACTTGMLCNDVKIRPMGKEMTRSALAVPKELNFMNVS